MITIIVEIIIKVITNISNNKSGNSDTANIGVDLKARFK